ncbi:hypothetical protein A4U61_07330 [Streptomyces sp. H-KF8]|nr:hypothetical protein A4U61_07330 [Streptomyces sp. H-KF8]
MAGYSCGDPPAFVNGEFGEQEADEAQGKDFMALTPYLWRFGGVADHSLEAVREFPGVVEQGSERHPCPKGLWKAGNAPYACLDVARGMQGVLQVAGQ